MSKFPTAVSASTPLPDVPLSAVELATFYPLHTSWPEYLLRFFRNDWTMSLVAKAQLYARDDLTQGEHTKRSNALRKAKKTAGDNKYGVTNFDSSQAPYSGYAELRPFVPTAHPQPWTAQQSKAHVDMYNPVQCAAPFAPSASTTLSAAHPTLRMVANGVVNYPQEKDAGQLTKVILWAAENGSLDRYTTAHIDSIARNPANVLRDGRRTSDNPPGAFGHIWDQQGADRTAALQRPW